MPNVTQGQPMTNFADIKFEMTDLKNNPHTYASSQESDAHLLANNLLK